MLKRNFLKVSGVVQLLFLPVILSANQDSCFCPYRYVGVEFGRFWSQKSTINVSIPPWDQAEEGYNSSLNSSSFYGCIFGYHFIKALRAEVSFFCCPDFNYKKKQEPTSSLGRKIRKFDLSNNSVLFNGYLHGSGFFCFFDKNYCGVKIDPFITGGLGVAYNWISSFRSESLKYPGEVFSMVPDRKNSSIAWQVGAGLDFQFSCMILSLGYRYLDAGSFKSNNYTLDDPELENISPSFQGVIVSNWKGKLRADGFFVAMRFPF